MEYITSRKNKVISHLKALGTDSAYRREAGQFILDGEKLLGEAMASGAKLCCVLWGGEKTMELPSGTPEYSCPPELMQAVSPLKNSRGPVFSLEIPKSIVDEYNVYNCEKSEYLTLSSAIILENVQDPGNVGTIIRTANAMGTGIVILVGDCADLFSSKTARASMGGVFRQPIAEMSIPQLEDYVNQTGLYLYGAALSEKAQDIRTVKKTGIAVAIGSEGSGLSEELLSICGGQLIIPMNSECESLNAAVAASIVMWEMSGGE